MGLHRTERKVGAQGTQWLVLEMSSMGSAHSQNILMKRSSMGQPESLGSESDETLPTGRSAPWGVWGDEGKGLKDEEVPSPCS